MGVLSLRFGLLGMEATNSEEYGGGDMFFCVLSLVLGLVPLARNEGMQHRILALEYIRAAKQSYLP